MSNSDRFHLLEGPPIFIVGAPRSGTTWTLDIFRNHPLVAGVHESWLFSPNGGLGALLQEGQWNSEYHGLGSLFEREFVIQCAREFVIKLFSQKIEAHHRFFVEKSPSHLHSVTWIREVLPDARFVYVIRDGRDVAVSIRMASQFWAPQWKQAFGDTVGHIARHWKQAIELGESHAKSMPGDWLEIRYEDIHADPFAAYKRLFDFAGIPYNDGILALIREKTDFKSNYKPGDHKFRRSGRVGDWRARFSLRDAWLFHQMAGEKLMELGYEDDPNWYRNFRAESAAVRSSD